MESPERAKRWEPKMTRGGFRFMFVSFTILALGQLVVLILFRASGGPWGLTDYVWAAAFVVPLGALVWLLLVRRHDKHFWDEEEARRADWDRRGRRL